MDRPKRRLLPPIPGENLFKMHQFKFDICPPQPPLQYPKTLYYPLDQARHTHPRTLNLQINEIHQLKTPCDLSIPQTVLNMQSKLFQKADDSSAKLDDKDRKLIEEIISEFEQSDSDDQKEVEEAQDLNIKQHKNPADSQENKMKRDKKDYTQIGYGGFENEIQNVFTHSEIFKEIPIEQIEHPTKKGLKLKNVYPLVPMQQNLYENAVINHNEVFIPFNHQQNGEIFVKSKYVQIDSDILRYYKEISVQQLNEDIKKRKNFTKQGEVKQRLKKLQKPGKIEDEEQLSDSDRELFEPENDVEGMGQKEKVEENMEIEDIMGVKDQEEDRNQEVDEDYKELCQESDQAMVKFGQKQLEQAELFKGTSLDLTSFIAKNKLNFQFRQVKAHNQDVLLLFDEETKCYKYIHIGKVYLLDREIPNKPHQIQYHTGFFMTQNYINCEIVKSKDAQITLTEGEKPAEISSALPSQKLQQQEQQQKQQKKRLQKKKKSFDEGEDDLKEFGEEDEDNDFDNIDEEDLEQKEKEVDDIFDNLDEDEEEDDEDEDEEDEGDFIEDDESEREGKKKSKKKKDKKSKKHKKKHSKKHSKKKHKKRKYSHSDEESEDPYKDEDEEEDINNDQDSMSSQVRRKQKRKMQNRSQSNESGSDENGNRKSYRSNTGSGSDDDRENQVKDIFLEGNHQDDEEEEQFTFSTNKKKVVQEQTKEQAE